MEAYIPLIVSALGGTILGPILAKLLSGSGMMGVFGGILGGKKGALAGIVIGGGAGTAVVLTTAGDDIDLPPGTTLTMTLDQPVEIRVPIIKG